MINAQVSTKSDWVPYVFGVLALVCGAVAGLLVASIPDVFIMVAAVLGVLALIASIWRVELGLLVLVFITYTRLSDVLIKFHGAPSIMRAFIPLLLAVIVIRWLLYGERPQGWARTASLILMYGLVGFSSLLYAPYLTSSLQNISYFARDAVIAIVVAALIHRPATLRRVVWALLVAGIFIGTIGVIQQMTGNFTNVYGGFAQSKLMTIVGDTSGYRIGGPVDDANFFGQIMLVMIPLALDRLRGERSVTLQLLAGWALTVSTLTVVFTFSRAAFLGLILVLGLTLFRRRPRVITLLVIFAVFMIVLQFVPAQYTERMMTLLDFVPGLGQQSALSDPAIEDRASAWGVAWLMFSEHPLLGVGLGNYEMLYPEYSIRFGLEPGLAHASAHSLYWEIAAETGLAGLFAFGILLWVMFRTMANSIRILRELNRQDDARLVLAFRTALIGYLFAATFLHDSYPRYFWLLFGIAMATFNVANHELNLHQERRIHAE